MSMSMKEATQGLGKDFLFGVATAAFQIEGASREGGRTDSIWDVFCREPGKVKNGDNGEQACEHYYRWREDLNLIEQLGFDAYRLSIAWPRIMPEPGVVSEEGLQFYVQLVDALNAKGIKPYVTLYHWDLPAYLEQRGGWLNRETAFKFAEYAEVVVQALGDRVASYATLNEPWCSAFLGYRYGIHAPGKTGEREGFQAAHHLLLAHGLAIPKMRAAAPKAQHGIVLNFTPAYAHIPQDQAAVELSNAENSYWFIEPLLTGRYPSVLEQARYSAMPLVLDGDMAVISTPIDFLGVNFYSRSVVTSSRSRDQLYEVLPPDSSKVEVTDIGWEVYPQGLTDLLVDLHQRYRLPPVYITENGAACADELINGQVEDDQRCRYYLAHLQAVANAKQQGVDIRGYFCWSLMDNFEWAEGYSKRFGIVHVDYQTQLRTPKQSALMFREWLKQRGQEG